MGGTLTDKAAPHPQGTFSRRPTLRVPRQPALWGTLSPTHPKVTYLKGILTGNPPPAHLRETHPMGRSQGDLPPAHLGQCTLGPRLGRISEKVPPRQAIETHPKSTPALRAPCQPALRGTLSPTHPESTYLKGALMDSPPPAHLRKTHPMGWSQGDLPPAHLGQCTIGPRLG